MSLKLKIVFTFSILFCWIKSSAQHLDIEVIQQGEDYADSSFYDILEVNDELWIGGKYGILKKYRKDGSLENIDYPSENLDIYKMDMLDENRVIASADKGTILIHDLKKNEWESRQIEGYENSCFYNLAVLSPEKIYVSGGNSKIAHSKKTVPEGFILESTDGGITWKEVYSNPFKMVWCVKKNEFDGQLYALMYTINKTHLFKFENDKWNKVEKVGNSIFHEVQFLNNKDYIATGGWIGKKGRLHLNDREVVINHSGLIWGRTANQKYELYPACNGQIVLGDKKGNYQLFGKKLNKDFSIYETIFTSENTAIAIGSARTLLKLTIKEG
ncbi:WD40/YVTN/BNR-like repeat-containing protein [Jiulongibacter sp. NS-SX5]|uniref:WD40/YVTN/BNR-like repeat-containing protein n=1 Tax=Jiulongibacter sp. NS-SX5 TaxID=3463854 RepID=UPI004057D281